MLFVPHLVPAVRGVVTTATRRSPTGATTDALTACLADAYAGAPFVRVLPPGEMVDSKRTRGTNVVELQAVADPRTGTAVVIGAARQPGEGRRRPGDPEPEPGPRPATRPPALPTAGGVPVSVTFPRGFTAAGRDAPGFKPSGRPDLGLLVGEPGHDGRRRCSPRTAWRPRPSQLGARIDSRRGHGAGRDREQRPGQRRDGRARGRRRARVVAAAAADALGVEPADVLPCSTGVIGEPMHMEPLLAGAADRSPAR